MPSASSWLMLVPSSLRLPAPVNLGVRLSSNSRRNYSVSHSLHQMDIRETIKHAHDYALSDAAILDCCKADGITLEDFCNQFAKAVAADFLSDQIDYDYGDQVMNFLFSFMTDPLYQSRHSVLPEPAWSIYLAFDRGEYRNKECDRMSDIPSEKYTRPELARILTAS